MISLQIFLRDYNKSMSILTTKPVTQVPNTLIYRLPNSYRYKMMSKDVLGTVGEMVAFPVRENNQKFLWIDFLAIYNANRLGFGTKFLNFAKNLSKKSGCEGNMKLEAGTTQYDLYREPHQFYRKYGFGSDDKKTLRKVDRANQYNKQLKYKDVPKTEMYYPETKPKSFLQKVLTKLGL